MNPEHRLDALDRATDGLNYDDQNILMSAMLGSLSALVDDATWNRALATGTEYVAASIERRRARLKDPVR